MPVPENRVAFTLFGIDIMWYGVLITLGMALAIIVTCYRAPKHGLDADRVVDFVLVCVPVGVIGARLYFVAFNWQDFAGNLMRLFNLRLGGLAVHGGLIFGIIAALILCRVWRIRPLNALDLAAPSIALAQAVGRWGNWFNREAHGGPTDLPWGMLIDGQRVHPTFLYESLWCLLLFLFLIYMDNRRNSRNGFEGRIFLLYCILYSAERFFVEGLRTDSLMLFGVFRQAQVLSACVIIVSLAAWVILRRKLKRAQ